MKKGHSKPLLVGRAKAQSACPPLRLMAGTLRFARPTALPSQRSAARSSGCGNTLPFSLAPQRGEMERREAPGRCATAPLWRRCVTPDANAPCKGGIASPVPRRARAVILRLAKPRHRTAAPPGAPPAADAGLARYRPTNQCWACPISANQPANAAFTASAPKELGLFSGPSLSAFPDRPAAS
jgi:hypothetical protein